GQLVVEGAHVPGAGRLQDLCRRHLHVLQDLELVRTPGALDVQRRHAPLVLERRMQCYVVVMPGQAFSPAADRELPRSESIPQGLLEFRPKPPGRRAAVPVLAGAAALKAVATYKLRVAVGDVAKARHVDTVRPVPEGLAVFHAGKCAARAGTERMVHQ